MSKRSLFRHSFAFRAAATWIAASGLGGAISANAHDYSALVTASKFDELDRVTQAALATNPGNADALLGRVDLILAQGAESRVDEAVKLAEQCVQVQPQRSECHDALGNALGNKALRAGIFSAMGYAGRIRDSFKKAVDLDPDNLSARFSLLQFYQQAPGVMGGGKDQALGLVAQTQKINADAARLMLGSLDLSDKDIAKAETAGMAALPLGAAELQDQQRRLLMGVGSSYVQAKKYADATRVFGEVQRRFPQSESGSYGMGRTLQELGKPVEALAQFERALAVKATAITHYRMAQSWVALADKPKAIAAFEKAIAFKPELGKKQREDAQEQLKSLKG